MPHSTEPVSPEKIAAVIDDHMHLEGPLLPMLHALQARFGHVPQMAVPMLADALNISKAEVHGVVSFYHDFREVPAGRHVVKICRAEACKSVGADQLGALPHQPPGSHQLWQGVEALLRVGQVARCQQHVDPGDAARDQRS